ncbi:MAG: primosomal protein N' [Oscillospiraceae bacterium]|nr:primosomal protein N' [Oscillospiraceae bacterium]
MLVAEVAVENTAYSYDKLFIYKIPKNLEKKIKIGQQVLVPFGNKNEQRKGLVFKLIADFSPSKPLNLKNICEINNEQPILTTELIRLATWLSKTVFCTYFEAVGTIFPSCLWKSKKQITVRLNPTQTISHFKLTSKQLAIIKQLSNGQTQPLSKLIKTCTTRSVINTLEKKGVIISELYTSQNVQPLALSPMLATEISLGPTDKKIYEQLISEFKKQKLAAALLFGPSFCDTLLFFKLAKKVLSSGKSTLLLVPEIEIIEQLHPLLIKYFGNNFIVIHRNLTNKERVIRWQQIKSSSTILVVGTRLAVFTPINNLGAIIVTEESGTSYISEHNPFYNALEVAKFRAKFNNCLLVFASPTPSVINLYKAKQGRFKLLQLPQETTAKITLVGKENNATIFAPELINTLSANMKNNKQSIIVLNQKGYSTIIRCSNCKNVLCCPHCSSNLVYHNRTGFLHCHRCNYKTESKSICDACGSEFIEYLGFGIEKVTAQLSKFFNARILKLDAENNTQDLEMGLQHFFEHQYDILVGTQAVLKCISAPNVMLVYVLGLDQNLLSNDYRGTEQTFSLIMQIAKQMQTKDSQIILQTSLPTDKFWKFIQQKDYLAFFEHELILRKTLNLPPFCDLIVIGFVSKNQNLAYNAACFFHKMIIEKINVTPPIPANTFQLNSNFRYKIVIKHKNDSAFRSFLRNLLYDFFNCHNHKNTHVFVDSSLTL